MASVKNMERLKSTGGGVDEVEVPFFPRMPDRVIERYPELEQWLGELEQWRRKFMTELNNKIGSIKNSSPKKTGDDL